MSNITFDTFFSTYLTEYGEVLGGEEMGSGLFTTKQNTGILEWKRSFSIFTLICCTLKNLVCRVNHIT